MGVAVSFQLLGLVGVGGDAQLPAGEADAQAAVVEVTVERAARSRSRHHWVVVR